MAKEGVLTIGSIVVYSNLRSFQNSFVRDERAKLKRLQKEDLG